MKRISILILGFVMTFSFSAVIYRYAFAENQLKEIIPGNANSLDKLFSMNGSTAVFLDNRRLVLGSSKDNKITIWDKILAKWSSVSDNQ
jgi:hypothetical protein